MKGKKWVFCNWPCNLLFELQWPLITHCISILLGSECYHTSCKSCNSLYIWCKSMQLCHNNSFPTTTQFPYDYNHNLMLMSFFSHSSKINTWHYGFFFWNIDIHHPLWLFILYDLKLWHVAQFFLKMWNINWILETYIYIYKKVGT